jgi:hypothetical protein
MDPKEDLEDYLTYLPRYGIAGAIVIVAWFLIQAVKEAKSELPHSGKVVMKRILCWFGWHDWDLRFFADSLNTYEECTRCKKLRSGWLK